jgi:hypothetical protein
VPKKYSNEIKKRISKIHILARQSPQNAPVNVVTVTENPKYRTEQHNINLSDVSYLVF